MIGLSIPLGGLLVPYASFCLGLLRKWEGQVHQRPAQSLLIVMTWKMPRKAPTVASLSCEFCGGSCGR